MADQVGNETEVKPQNGENITNQNPEIAAVELKSNLLVVVGEPFNVEQKDSILERIVIELSNWDVEQSKCDLNQQLNSTPSFQSTNQEEKKFEHDAAELHVTILINPSLESTIAAVTSFLATASKYKYLLHSGPALLSNGAWLLQDGAFTFHLLQEIIRKLETLADYKHIDSTLVDVSLVEKFGEWNDATIGKLAPKLKIRLSRPPTSLRDESGLIKFSDNISAFLKPFSVVEKLKTSDTVGSVSFVQPTCYIFPAGQGSSLLFGVEGFTMLVDGGYKRNCTFWDFVKHLNRIDTLLISRLSYDNIFGLLSFFEKKSTDKGGPEVGVVMLNVGDTRHKTPNPVANSNNGGSGHTTSGLIVSIAEEGRLLAEHMSIIHLTPPHSIIGSAIHPINLYHKVGHGSLDMYIISPTHDSKELKEFLNQWSKSVDSYKGGLPIGDQLSVCFALLWKPAAHLKQNCMRLLYPGRVSNQKLYEGLDKLKNIVEFSSQLGQSQEKANVIKKPPTSTTSNVNKAKVGGAKPPQQPIASKQDVKKSDTATGSFGKTPSSSSLDHKTTNDAKKTDAKKPTGVKKMTPASDSHKTTGSATTTTTAATKPSPTTSKQPPSASNATTNTTSPQKSPTKTGAMKTPNSGPKTPKGSDKKHEEQKKSTGTPVPHKAQHGVSATSTPLKNINKDGAVVVGEKLSVKESLKGEEDKEVEEVKDDSSSSQQQQSPEQLPSPQQPPSSPEQPPSSPQQQQPPPQQPTPEQLPSPQQPSPQQPSPQQHPSSPHEPDQQGDQGQEFDPTKQWDKPVGLPTPMKPETNQDQAKTNDGGATNLKSPDKAKKLITNLDKGQSKRPITAPEKLNTTMKEDPNKSVSQAGPKKSQTNAVTKATTDNKSDVKKSLKPVVGFYVDLAYIPCHCDVEFFRKVRSKYYVLSSAYPDARLVDNLIEARATWEDSQSEVNIVPTHDTQVLRDWLKNKADRLIGAKVVITPPASRCAVQLEEKDSGFNAFRIQF